MAITKSRSSKGQKTNYGKKSVHKIHHGKGEHIDFSNNSTRVKHYHKRLTRTRGLSGFWNSKEAIKDKRTRFKSGSALSSASYNEKVIASWLKSYNISFTFQATFKGCKDI